MNGSVRIVMMRQDDPKKCTAAKMVRFGMARPVRRPPSDGILLHPYAKRVLLRADCARNICALDCSWRLAPREFAGSVSGRARRLPPLLAGNPTNYSKVGLLTTAEAVAAALHITGSAERAALILDKFRWGHTFLEMNAGPLQEYADARDEDHIYEIAKSYRLCP